MCPTIDFTHFIAALLFAKWWWKLLVLLVLGLFGAGLAPRSWAIDPWGYRRAWGWSLVGGVFFVTRWVGLALWESIQWNAQPTCQSGWPLWISGPVTRWLLVWGIPVGVTLLGIGRVRQISPPEFLRFTSGNVQVDQAVRALPNSLGRFKGFYRPALIVQYTKHYCALWQQGELGISPKIFFLFREDGQRVRDPRLAWRVLWVADAARQLGVYENVRARAVLYDNIALVEEDVLANLSDHRIAIYPALNLASSQLAEQFERLLQIIEILAPWLRLLKEDIERLGKWAYELQSRDMSELWEEDVANMERRLKALSYLREHPTHWELLAESGDLARQLQSWLESTDSEQWRQSFGKKVASSLATLLQRWLDFLTSWEEQFERGRVWWFTVRREDWVAWCRGLALLHDPLPAECDAPGHEFALPESPLTREIVPPALPSETSHPLSGEAQSGTLADRAPPSDPSTKPSDQGEDNYARLRSAVSDEGAILKSEHTEASATEGLTPTSWSAVAASWGSTTSIVSTSSPENSPSLRASDLPAPPSETSASDTAAPAADMASECPGAPQPPTDEQGLPFGPADLAFLLHGDRVGTVAMVIATVLDLARRGYVLLESLSYPPTGDAWRQQARWRRQSGADPQALRAYEAWLLEALFAGRDDAVLSMNEFYRLVPSLVPGFAERVETRMQRYVPLWGLARWGSGFILAALLISWGVGVAILFSLEDWLAQMLSPRWASNLILISICLWVVVALIGVMSLWMALERRFLRPRDPALRRWVQWWEQVDRHEGAAFWLAQEQIRKDEKLAQQVVNACLIYRAVSFSTLMLSGALGLWLEEFGEAFPSLTLPWWRVYARPTSSEQVLRWSEALVKYAAPSLPVMIEEANIPAMTKDMVGSQSRLRRLYSRLEQLLGLGDEPPAAAERVQVHLQDIDHAAERAIQVPAETIKPPPEPKLPVWYVWIRRISLVNFLVIGGIWGLLFAGTLLALLIFDPAPWGFVPYTPPWWSAGLLLFTLYASFAITFHLLLPNEYEWQDAFKPKEVFRSLLALVMIGLFLFGLQAMLMSIVERELFHALHHLAVQQGDGQSVEFTALLAQEPRLEIGDDEKTLWLTLQLFPPADSSEVELEINSYSGISEETLNCLQNLPVGAQGLLQGQRTAFGLEIHTLVLAHGLQRCEAHVPETHTWEEGGNRGGGRSSSSSALLLFTSV